MKVHAPRFGTWQEALGIAAKEEYRGIIGLAFIEQMKVGEHID